MIQSNKIWISAIVKFMTICSIITWIITIWIIITDSSISFEVVLGEEYSPYTEYYPISITSNWTFNIFEDPPLYEPIE